MTELDKETLIDFMHLCHIQCSDEELKLFFSNFQAILKYIDQLNEVNTDGVAICTHLHPSQKTLMREDIVENTLDRDVFLKNAPSYVGGMIRVPTVIQF